MIFDEIRHKAPTLKLTTCNSTRKKVVLQLLPFSKRSTYTALKVR